MTKLIRGQMFCFGCLQPVEKLEPCGVCSACANALDASATSHHDTSAAVLDAGQVAGASAALRVAA